LVIRFNNWEKYQQRKDIKNPWWFALKNDFATNPNFLKFTKDEKLCFIYLLCEASKTNKNGILIVETDFMSDFFGMPSKTITQTIEKLIKRKICIYDTESHVQIRTDPYKSVPTDRQTEQTEHTQKPPTGGSAADEFFNLWNNQCGSLPKARELTPKRIKSIKQRLAEEPDMNTWSLVINKMAKSDFCNGNGSTGWKADFDFLLKPDTRAKVLEGKYDNKKNAITQSEFKISGSKTIAELTAEYERKKIK
jgi:hypothetical protein